VCDYTIYRAVLVGIVQKDMSLRIGWKGLESGDSVLNPTWRKAGTIISRRLSPFGFRVASMLSREGKSLCKDHCAPTRSHDRRIATHRRRVLCVIRRNRHCWDLYRFVIIITLHISITILHRSCPFFWLGGEG